MKKRMQEVIQLASDLGLDPFPVIYETIQRTTMDNICAYGLPTRARHWSYGRSYDHQKTYGEMGYSKVYEVILNNNPSYAFLLDTNSEVQNLFVAAHCEGHSHFFKHNCMFQNTDRNMVSHAAERAGRVEEYIEKHGSLPSNLVVRLSAHKVDFPAPSKLAKRLGVQTSSVVTSSDFTCPSSKQGNKCLECRACWDKSIDNVSYSKH